MIRVCPERDAVCPHGMDCPFAADAGSKYRCRDGWWTLPDIITIATEDRQTFSIPEGYVGERDAEGRSTGRVIRKDAERCIACGIAFNDGDEVYNDTDGGYIHAICSGSEPEGYVDANGAPLKPGDPLPRPWKWVGETATELIALRERLAEETRIVNRVWAALGISTFEQAGGREISEIVAALSKENERLRETLERLSAARSAMDGGSIAECRRIARAALEQTNAGEGDV